MAAPRKYPDELRERAIRMAVELRRDPATKTGALRRVADQLGINPETLRNWVNQAEIDAGDRPGTTTTEQARIAELERENRELRRANHILKSASMKWNRWIPKPAGCCGVQGNRFSAGMNIYAGWHSCAKRRSIMAATRFRIDRSL